MKILGFSFTELKAYKKPSFKKCSINNHIEFEDVKFDSVSILKESLISNISFEFSLNYQEDSSKSKDLLANISFKGIISLSLSKEEKTELEKSWKKKKLSDSTKLPLLNYILKKCSLRALQIQEELNLPTHISFPQIKIKSN